MQYGIKYNLSDNKNEDTNLGGQESGILIWEELHKRGE